jgi:hypothetical protein
MSLAIAVLIRPFSAPSIRPVVTSRPIFALLADLPLWILFQMLHQAETVPQPENGDDDGGAKGLVE